MSTQLDWLVGSRLESIDRAGDIWSLKFDRRRVFSVWCLWRLLEHGVIQRTSEDDGHQFGLPAPVDALAELRLRLNGSAISGVALRDGTLDVVLTFDNGAVLEVVQNSSGYEAWTANNAATTIVGQGGGNVSVFG